MTIRSYAQNFEDVLLWRALKDVPRGHYVDVGAGHPSRNSVTRLFYDAGWDGLNVEPLPHLAAELSRTRQRDVTVQAAVSTTSGPTIDLIAVGLWDELSTVSTDRAQQLREQGRDVAVVEVPVARLDDLVLDRGWPDVHFLKVDVEGAELDVLRTLDLSRTRPWVVLVEVVAGGDENASRAEINAHLSAHGYRHVWFDGLNDFFVAEERSADLVPRFGVPVNVTDDFTSVSDSDQVMVELIADKLGMSAPVQASEVLQRVEGVLHDRIHFETELRQVEEHDTAVDELRARLHRAELTCQALEQVSFERERLIAWYAAEVANHRAAAARAAQDDRRRELDTDELRRAHEDTRQRLDQVLSSTSWRTTLPIRAARRPQTYLRRLLQR